MKTKHHLLLISFLLLINKQSFAQNTPDFFDIHTHYKWEQEEVTTPKQAIQALKQAEVKKAVVIGRPADYALKLYKLDPDRIIPIFGPYRSGSEKMAWQFRKPLIEETRKGLQSGNYFGIGELHLIGGMATKWQKSDVFKELLKLGVEFNVPIMVHIEFASAKPALSICQSNPKNKILFAHAGAVLPPEKVKEILERCPNAYMDLAARDPWRYIDFPITDKKGKLLKSWNKLITNYADRFMVGSDPVWPVDKGFSWDEPDSGWLHLKKYIQFHRNWLSHLPKEIEEKIRWSNAKNFFKVN